MTMQGMDTEAALAASDQIDAGSEQIAMLAQRLDNALHDFEWTGPDAEDTRAQWAGTRRPMLDTTSAHLASLAVLLRREAGAQDVASGTGSVAAPGGAAVAGGGSWWDRVSSAVGSRVSAALAALDRAGGHFGEYYAKIFDALTGRENWSVAEVAASLIAGYGSAAGAIPNAVTGVDQHWFDDGPGAVGTPVPAGGAHPLTPPTDLSSVMGGVTAAYGVGESGTGDIRITKVDNGAGPPTWIVAVPGTESWGPAAGDQPHDLTANIAMMAGNPSAAAETIRQAMAAAGIPPGAQVLGIGHSQAGIGWGLLASDPAFASSYDLSVVTYGAPIDQVEFAPGVNALQMQHADDLVPTLDLGGYGTGWAAFPNDRVPTVVLPSPGEGLSVNHDFNLYAQSVQQQIAAGTPAGQQLQAFQDSLAPFFVQPGGTATAVDVPVHRRP